MAAPASRNLKMFWLLSVLSGIAGGVALLFDVGACRWEGVPRYAERYGTTYDVARHGRRAVYGSPDGVLRLLDLGTGVATPLSLAGPAGPRGFPAFSPDGKSVAFSAESDLWIASLDGRHARRLTRDTAFSELAPAFSPDGKTLVFARPRNNPFSPTGVVFVDYDVWTVRRDGTGLRRLTTERYQGVSGAQFAPNGRTVIFAANVPTDDFGGSRAALLEVDPWTNEPTPTPREIDGGTADEEGGSYVHDPAVSPDGARIAFISDRALPWRYDVCLLSRDGAHFRTLGITETCEQPRFSPDGQSLYFLSRGILWRTGLDGKNAKRVAVLAR